jgi:hypothetical protein
MIEQLHQLSSVAVWLLWWLMTIAAKFTSFLVDDTCAEDHTGPSSGAVVPWALS